MSIISSYASAIQGPVTPEGSAFKYLLRRRGLRGGFAAVDDDVMAGDVGDFTSRGEHHLGALGSEYAGDDLAATGDDDAPFLNRLILTKSDLADVAIVHHRIDRLAQ